MVVASVLFLSGFASSGRAQDDPTKEILVYFTSGVERAAIGQAAARTMSPVTRASLARFGISEDKVTSAFPDFNESDTLKRAPDGRIVALPNMSRIFRIRVPDGVKREVVIDSLKKLPNVLFAEPNGRAAAQVIPNDQYFSYQWSLQPGGGTGKIQAPEAWDMYKGSSSSIVGVIDWGVDGTHPDLSAKVSGDAPSGVYHGTHVAGIAAAKTDNSTGVAGVNWNAQLLSKNIESSDDPGVYQKIVDAVNYSSNVNVLNNSWTLINSDYSPRYSTTVRMAFAYAYKMNRVAVCANGNYQQSFPGQTYFPAGYGHGIIAVGATNSLDAVANFSQVNNGIDVAAPGVSVYSTYRYPDYEYLSGTSMAAPHVSGIASLLKGYNPNLDNDDIEHIIQLSADKVRTDLYTYDSNGWNSNIGFGRVNVFRALRNAAAPVVLNHQTATGGTDVGSSGTYTTVFYGVPGYATAVYIVRRHEVQKSITYSTMNEAHVWGRGVSTVGSSIENPIYGMGWCDAVPGTVTSTGATLRTYVYEVWNVAGQWLGWYPTTPSNVVYAYTVWGLPTTLASGHIGPGVWNVTSTMTIPAGTTVYIDAGATLKFASGASLISNGVLHADGNSSQQIAFTRSGTSGNWGSVQFNGSGSAGSTLDYVNIDYGTQVDVLNTSNVSIKHCNITNNSGHGINVNYSSNFLAQYNSILNTNWNHGILINGGSNNSCYDNVIKKTDNNRQGAGIQFGGTGGNVGRNDIRSYNWGIGAIWGASPYARTSYGMGKNNRITNCQIGLMVYRSSYPIFGTPPPSDFMWNSIYGNTYNACVGTSYPEYASGLAAYGNWWGSAPPPSNYQVGPNSWFYFNPYLSSDPWYGVPLPSVQPAEAKGAVVASVSSAPPSDKALVTQAAGQEVIDEDPLFEGINFRNAGKFQAAKDFFVSYLGTHPDNQRAYVELYNCYHDGKDGSEETSEEIMEYFKSLPQSASEDHKLLLSYMYLNKGDVKSAWEVNSRIESGSRNKSLGVKAMLNNFYIALYCEKDPQTAESILKDVVKKKALSTPMELSTAQTALATYVDPKTGQMPYSSSMAEAVGQDKEVTAQLPDEGGMIQNYPNPFNPTTTISYRLPNSGKVELKVYDVLGREVMTLVRGYQEAGVHTAYFNGQNLASGVYFYRLTAPGITQVKKMLLTK